MNIEKLWYIQAPNNDELIFRFKFEGIDEMLGYRYNNTTQKVIFMRGVANDQTVSLIKSHENNYKRQWIQALILLALKDDRYNQYHQRLKNMRIRCTVI
ncbi:hypothetical protein [Peribacillus frigoritolerans]|uniref:hypothetical protein n=1 Tax=Peribacillus frigoritolerans TaxID=450367 RepID=UPI00215B14E1|nr:hypothetical protein [Peribacillus frigoritolerans]MCR8870533.1 hypothetical protein [Peribacillus frigoritolerans]